MSLGKLTRDKICMEPWFKTMLMISTVKQMNQGFLVIGLSSEYNAPVEGKFWRLLE